MKMLEMQRTRCCQREWENWRRQQINTLNAPARAKSNIYLQRKQVNKFNILSVSQRQRMSGDERWQIEKHYVSMSLSRPSVNWSATIQSYIEFFFLVYVIIQLLLIQYDNDISSVWTSWQDDVTSDRKRRKRTIETNWKKLFDKFEVTSLFAFFSCAFADNTE